MEIGKGLTLTDSIGNPKFRAARQIGSFPRVLIVNMPKITSNFSRSILSANVNRTFSAPPIVFEAIICNILILSNFFTFLFFDRHLFAADPCKIDLPSLLQHNLRNYYSPLHCKIDRYYPEQKG